MPGHNHPLQTTYVRIHQDKNYTIALKTMI
jgi:hypothetical protein